MLSKTKIIVLRSVVKEKKREEIIKYSKKSGKPIGQSSLYSLLPQLEKEGLIEKIEQTAKTARKKTTAKPPVKKTKSIYKYKATKEGLKVLKTEKKEIVKFLKFVEIK